MNNLLNALEAALAEVRRLEEDNQDLRHMLENYEKQPQPAKIQKNRRPRKNNRTYRPWQKQEESLPLNMPQIETAHRRNVHSIFKEQVEKHESRVAKELARQKEVEDGIAENAERDRRSSEVHLSESKKRLLVETAKTLVDKSGN